MVRKLWIIFINIIFLDCAVSIPPLRSEHEVPLKEDAEKKFKVEWELAYPNVNFHYRLVKEDKTVVYSGKLDFNCLLEKFGLKKDDNVNKNVNSLVNTLVKCFNQNKVTLEPWQIKYFAIEFKGEEDKTLFKVFLKDD